MSALVVFEVARLRIDPSAAGSSFGPSCLDRSEGASQFATIRRYHGVDQNRTTELASKVNETLVPKLNRLPGFKGYYLIDAWQRRRQLAQSLRSA